jgi:hypothetical protein
MAAELSSAPSSTVPSNNGAVKNRFPSRAAAIRALVCAIGNSVPAGKRFTSPSAPV